jgi:glycerol dehydrogenase
MAGAFGGPNTYIQRGGEIRKLATHVAPIGKRAVVVMDRAVEASLSSDLRDDFDKQGIEARFATFGGECTTGEIDRIGRLARDCGSQVLIGVGGGKTADTVKSAAVAVDARIVIVPTIASSDAPCSAITVRYSPNGVFEESVNLPRHPDLVLVDTDIVVQAPARFLVAGIGDALSTWFEARSNMESRSKNYVAGGFPPTRAGIAVARECHEVLMRDAVLATMAVEKKLFTTAVDNIIEANILLSGLGFENVGCSAAHGIHDGLTVLDETHGFLHGEKVAFGTLCLLMLESRPIEEIEAMIRFCRSVGLPTTLGDLNIRDVSRSAIERVAVAALAPGESTFATPVALTVPLVTDAIIALDAFAQRIAVSA